jgi:dGTPase
MVEDVLVTSRRHLQALNPASAQAIRDAGAPVIRFSAPLWRDLQEIRAFLFARMYRAPAVLEMRQKVTKVIEELFPLFLSDTALLPPEWREDVARAEDEVALARIVGDYIAGMTDRFALETHARLLG